MLANPQRENGFTGIANEILDRVAMLKCNGTQFRIIMVVGSPAIFGAMAGPYELIFRC